jgi:general secretion pathway protein F
MPAATLDDFMALNDQLAALVAAGVPLDVDVGHRQADIVARLEKVNAAVARRVSQGASLADAISGDKGMTSSQYRGVMRVGLQSGNLASGFEASNQLASAHEQSAQAKRISLIYPAVVACLALLGIAGFCLFIVPVLADTYRSLEIPAGRSMRVLETLRATLPWWVAVAVLGLIAVLVSQRRLAPLFSRAAGSSRTARDERCALFAESAARLLEGGAPLPEALRAAAETWGDGDLTEQTRALAARLDCDDATVENHSLASYPPLLRWALLDSAAATNRPAALRIAADVYRQSASVRRERIRAVVPIVAGIVIGGGATLLYGLALFLPVIEMLHALALQATR